MQLYQNVRQIIEAARLQSLRAVNSILLKTYWEIGRLIVEDEQEGKTKAEYGKGVVKNLAQQLTLEFGKGFDERNLNNMRAFYAAFPIWYALRTELSWTHYRIISRQETEEKRLFYMNEAAAANWNSRQLERNIHSLYFERTTIGVKKDAVQPNDASYFVKDPYILEFAALSGTPLPVEKYLENALITHLQQFLMELGKGLALWPDSSTL